MYIPAFALKKKEKEILSIYLTRPVNITLKERLKAYVVDEHHFEEIIDFVSQYREGEAIQESMNEAGAPSAIPNTNRANVLRAVTTIFNVIVDAQQIKDPETKTAAMAGILAAAVGVLNISPDYGQRLLSIIRSKI